MKRWWRRGAAAGAGAGAAAGAAHPSSSSLDIIIVSAGVTSRAMIYYCDVIRIEHALYRGFFI
jgi:hypothetical protein